MKQYIAPEVKYLEIDTEANMMDFSVIDQNADPGEGQFADETSFEYEQPKNFNVWE